METLARQLLRDTCRAPRVGVDPALACAVLDCYPLPAGTTASSVLEVSKWHPVTDPGALLCDSHEEQGLLTLIWSPQPGLQVGPMDKLTPTAFLPTLYNMRAVVHPHALLSALGALTVQFPAYHATLVYGQSHICTYTVASSQLKNPSHKKNDQMQARLTCKQHSATYLDAMLAIVSVVVHGVCVTLPVLLLQVLTFSTIERLGHGRKVDINKMLETIGGNALRMTVLPDVVDHSDELHCWVVIAIVCCFFYNKRRRDGSRFLT